MTRVDRRPKAFTLLVVFLVVAATVLTPTTAVRGQTEGGLTEQDVYREYGYVPMKDGVRLAYSLWRPKKGGQGRYPTLFQVLGVRGRRHSV